MQGPFGKGRAKPSAAGGTQAQRPSRAGPTPRVEGGCRRRDCSTRSGSAHIANVRRRSTNISHEYESSLNISRRVHHDARMLSANSASMSSAEQTCREVDMLHRKTYIFRKDMHESWDRCKSSVRGWLQNKARQQDRTL